MERQPINHLSLRMAGVALILAVLFVLDLNQNDPANQLWLPLLLAAGAFLMTLSAMAVAIAVVTLAILHMDLDSTFWVTATPTLFLSPSAAPSSAGLCCSASASGLKILTRNVGQIGRKNPKNDR